MSEHIPAQHDGEDLHDRHRALLEERRLLSDRYQQIGRRGLGLAQEIDHARELPLLRRLAARTVLRAAARVLARQQVRVGLLLTDADHLVHEVDRARIARLLYLANQRITRSTPEPGAAPPADGSAED